MDADTQNSSPSQEAPASDDEDSRCSIEWICPTQWQDHVQVTKLSNALSTAVNHLNLASCDLAIILIDDQKMTDMHDRHMGLPTTTDVLTFDFSDEPYDSGPQAMTDLAGRAVEGEIYICVDEATRQAEAHRHDVFREVLLYAVHGLLHLLGHDDHDDQAYAIMHRIEDELLEAIGIGRVFARVTSTTGEPTVARDRAETSSTPDTTEMSSANGVKSS